jgi:hypothetical protein
LVFQKDKLDKALATLTKGKKREAQIRKQELKRETL